LPTAVENWFASYVSAYPFWDVFWELPLPVFAVLLLLGEGALHFAGRNRTRAEFILCALVIAGSIAIWYFTQPVTSPRLFRPGAYFLYVAWIMAVPAALLTIVSHALARSRFRLVKHGGVALSAAMLAPAWPIFGLYSICASGLDCI
jgi:hypothetical protein